MTSPAGVARRSLASQFGASDLVIALGIAALSLITFFWFPGHTYLQSDTQIYIPLMERLWDPSLFTRDLLASRPHLAYTLYDEIAFVIRAVTHAPFRFALEIQQIVFRALGLWGVFLIGRALGLDRRLAFASAALFGLGATIAGPAVLTLEYEPVPRGFAVMLVICAIGLAAGNRPLAAAIMASVAFLYHAPATVPFWIVFAVVWYREDKRSARAWIPLAAAILIIIVASRLQAGIAERQVFFARLDPNMVAIQKIRAPYNWISLWPPSVFWHYGVLAAATGIAVWRLRAIGLPRAFLLGLTLIGLASVPFAYLTLDVYRWALMPQLQPARAVLFITAAAVIACAAAAMSAGARRNWAESAAWLLVPVIVPLHKSVLPLFTFNVVDGLAAREAVVLFGVAAAIAAVLVWGASLPLVRPALLVTVLCAYIAIPTGGAVVNYPPIWSPDLNALNSWARSSTPKTALFHFPQAGRALYPGVFRAEALRSVYVDWKTGGQVNYFKSLGEEWWSRWLDTMMRDVDARELRARGIDYVIVKSPSDWNRGVPVYSNPTYSVYKL
jgi:hypothetical protein